MYIFQIIECELCQHRTKIELNKPGKKETDSENIDTVDLDESVPPESITTTPINTKKKKKKTKDRTAGLKLDKNKNLTENNNKIQTKTGINKHEVPAATIKPQPSNKVVAKVIPSNKAAGKPNSSLSQSLKAKKQKQKKSKPTKIQSKTQQQNSLLKLAALLKSQTVTKSAANASQKRLESLLK